MDLTTQLETAARLIDRWLAYRVYADRLPGLALGIVYQDRVIFSKGYGYANMEKQTATTDTTCYRIASFSK
ncbi:MAG: serine hydrolase, partial [Ktedonobacteraceae bacterium]|nr:serine hydrolase [Ktedonobacteraceae bacterium]